MAVMVAAFVTDVDAATIVINNVNAAGVGFNDPTPAAPVGGNPGVTIGQQRLNAFTYAANIWGACLQSAVTIVIRAQMTPLTCTPTGAVLGSAGTTEVFRDFAGAPLPGTWYPKALANALFGTDLDAANPDISANFNSNLGNPGCLTGTFFYYGLDHNPPANTIDFVSVVVHEIGHGVGFQTFINSAGSPLAGFPDDFEFFLEQHGAATFWFPQMSDLQRAAGQISDPNLHWLGPLVTTRGLARLTAGMVGGHVQMHGPNPYQNGSSTSHWSTALTPNELMEPVYTGANHEPGLAWALLDEIGWTLCAQPENGCNAAVVDLTPPTGTVGSAINEGNEERGAFVTALKDFSVCSLGIEGDFVPGQTLTANIYAANGTARGALLATGATTIKFDGNRVHYVPIGFTLQKCKEYDIAIQFQSADSWPWWDENTMTQRPYDVGGVVRVRDGENFGLASNFALLHFQVRGSAATTELQNNMLVSGNGPASLGPEHGAFLTAQKTVSISKLGVNVQFVSAPSVLRAYVYNAAGNVRGSLVAEGVATVPSTAQQVITVPINAVLKEGKQYDIGFDFGTNSTRYLQIQPLPWVFGDLLTVNGVEFAGVLNGASQQFPNFEIAFSNGPGLNALDIVLPYLGAPDGYSTVSTLFGKYVKALHNQELSGLGFYANLAPGSTMTANVYLATGTTRGALISTGSIVTGPGGTRWHDVPVSATLVAGQNYDLEIDWTGTTVNAPGFPYWIGVGGAQPYSAYGLLSVIVGEVGGIVDPSQECADYRVYSCPVSPLTSVGPTVTPKFALHEAFPNPFSGATTIGYELDEATTVSVQVYDVAGRKVADVVNAKAMPKGPGQLTFEPANLASGVYFVKLSTPSKSVTRKITIIR
jgi:hypothetical protein